MVIRDFHGSIFTCLAGIRSYASGKREDYNLFGNVKPGDDDFRKACEKEMENDDDDNLWSGSEDESNDYTKTRKWKKPA